MNRIHKIFIMIILIMSSYSPIFSNDVGLTQDVYSKLCGVWDTRVPKTFKRKPIYCKDNNSYADTYQMSCSQFSWGLALNQVNVSSIIDLGADEPCIMFPGGMGYIYKISKSGKHSYIISIKNSADNIGYDLRVTFVDDEKLFFHENIFPKVHPLLGDEYGKDCIYTKTDAPVIKYHKPKVANLRLRSEPSSKSNIIRALTKDDKLLILRKGKSEKIESVKGIWMCVLTGKDEIGWCFDGYLEDY